MKIDNDFKNLLPELTAEEYAGLELDILEHGILSPIIVWNGTIIDGHNRYAIAQAHKLPDESIPTVAVNFNSKASAIEWIINNQKNRRNLTKSQLVAAWSKYEAEVAREAKERQGTRTDLNISKNFNESPEPIRTAAEVAAKIGVSEPTYRDMKLITEHGTEEQIARMDKGGKGNGVSAIAREIKTPKIKETFRCRDCGKLFLISEAHKRENGKTDNQCKGCHVKKDSEYKERNRLKGTDGFYVDSVEERIWTPEEITEQIKRDFDSFIDNLKIELDVHRNEIKTHEEMIDETIEIFVETLRLMKGVYR